MRELLVESVQMRLRADVGVGVYLSGGLDSSAIAGMVASLIEKGENLGNDSSRRVSEMSCFTVQFDKDSGFDESGEWVFFPLQSSLTRHPRYCKTDCRMAGRRLPSRTDGRRGHCLQA